MDKLNQAIFWYQKKIGTYDKQPWEKTVEERVLKNIHKVPRKITRLKSELIDVDLIRGSTFSKVKLQHGWLTVGLNGVARTVFMPFYFKWWYRQMSPWFFYCVITLFFAQVLTLAVYITDSGQNVGIERLSIAHILMPIVLMLIIGQVHGQVVATQLSRSRKWYSFSFRQRRHAETKKRKVKRKTANGVNRSQSVPAQVTSEGGSGTVRDVSPEMEIRQRRPSRVNKPTSENGAIVSNGNEGSESSGNEEASGACVHWEERKKAKLVKKVTKKKKKSSPPPSLQVPQISVADDKSSASVSSCVLPQTNGVDLKRNESDIGLEVTIGQESNDSSVDGVKVTRPNTLSVGGDNSAGDFSRDSGTKNSSSISADEASLGGLGEVETASAPDLQQLSGTEPEQSIPASPQVPALDVDYWDESDDSEISAGSDSETLGSSDSAYCAQDGQSVEWRRADAYAGRSTLDSTASRVSCLIWEGDNVQKIDLTGVDIGWSIIRKVDRISESSDFLRACVALAVTAMLVPLAFRVYHASEPLLPHSWPLNVSVDAMLHSYNQLFGTNWREQVIVSNGVIQRLSLSCIYFFLLAVAERTYKQRLLYAKYFTCLTSSRRARKYDLPHFRLNKVDNIKTWLSLRSYLKKRGPQRSVDAIVTATFYLHITCLSLVCVELLRDPASFLDYMGNWEMLAWTMILSVFLMRFMTLGSQITKKYRSFSILITEQINLYLQLEQKPHKKEELMVANNVLKLSEGLLKELDSPFRITALSTNPILHNVLKLVILSAFSAALSELLGFNLRLYKIKFRA